MRPRWLPAVGSYVSTRWLIWGLQTPRPLLPPPGNKCRTLSSFSCAKRFQAAWKMCGTSDSTKLRYKHIIFKHVSLQFSVHFTGSAEQKLALCLTAKLHKRHESVMFSVSFHDFAFFMKGSKHLWKASRINSQSARLLARDTQRWEATAASCFLGQRAKVQATGSWTNMLTSAPALSSEDILGRLCFKQTALYGESTVSLT